MKKTFLFVGFSSLVMLACNNEGKDPVEKADSANKEARTDTSTVAPAPDPVTSSFLVDAANGGMAEVQLSNIAAERSGTVVIKDFANMMIKDHTDANNLVKGLAAQKNVTLPADISDEKRKTADDLAKKTGKDFDKDYVDIMIKDHEKTIDLFEKGASDVKDAEVVGFINNTLPKLRTHLEAIKAIKKNMK